jgi:hypothetical protein
MDQQRNQQPVDENNNPKPKYSPFGTSNGSSSRRMGGRNMGILAVQNGQQNQMMAQFEVWLWV